MSGTTSYKPARGGSWNCSLVPSRQITEQLTGRNPGSIFVIMTSSHNQRQSWTSVRTPFIINPFPPPSVLQGRQSSIWFYLLLFLLCPGLLAVPLEEDINMPRSHAPPGSQVLTQGRWAGSERVSAGCPGVLETVCRPGWDHFRPGCFSCYQRARTTVICCGPNVTDVPTDLPTNVTHL